MKLEIIPSLLVESQAEFERRLRLVEPHVKTVHLDILDGTLVPFTSWHDARAISAIATPVVYELHLMVENPLAYVEAWKAAVPNFVRAIFHVEIPRPVGTIMETIQQVHKLEAGLALNPETPFDEVHHELHAADAILLMGVVPGQSGQAMSEEATLEKLHQIRAHFPETPIEVDGGVRLENIAALKAAGATRFCSAAAIFTFPDPTAAIKQLQSSLSA